MAPHIPGFTPMEDQGDGLLHYQEDPQNNLIDPTNEISNPPIDDLHETILAQQVYINPRRRVDSFTPLNPKTQLKVNSFSHRDPNLAPCEETETCIHCETIPQV